MWGYSSLEIPADFLLMIERYERILAHGDGEEILESQS